MKKMDLVFDSLDECLKAEQDVAGEYTREFNTRFKWAQENPEDAAYPKSREFQLNRIGLYNKGTCIPAN